MNNQRVLVTAGASGIGRESARAFAARGAGVFVCDIDAGGLEALAAEVAGLQTAVCDVSKRQEIESMVASAAASLAGRYGYPNCSPYCVSKWGLVGFTKTLSIELGGHGIRANAVLPGAADGPRIQRVFEGRAAATGRAVEEVRQDAMAIQSLKRLVDPRDIAALCVFLASDAGKSISGQMRPIDNDPLEAS